MNINEPFRVLELPDDADIEVECEDYRERTGYTGIIIPIQESDARL